MNKTDKRQFLDELSFWGESKENSSTFYKAIKGAITLKDIEDTLENKKKAYNYTYTNIYRKYGVQHDDLYGELDKIWNICLNEGDDSKREEHINNLAKVAAAGAAASAAAATGVAATTAASTCAIFSGIGLGIGTTASIALGQAIAAISLGTVLGPGVLGAGLFHVFRRVLKVKKIWNSYKQYTRDYAANYVELTNDI